jgi:hypothetical protein
MSSDSEETPLLSSGHNDVYLRFSPTRKSIILVTVSACGLLNCMFIVFFVFLITFLITLLILVFVVGTFTPSIPQIAKDLNTTGAVIK